MQATRNSSRAPRRGAFEASLRQHLATRRVARQKGLSAGCGDVDRPESLLRKYPDATREWAWQSIFPSATMIYLHVTRRPGAGGPSPLDMG